MTRRIPRPQALVALLALAGTAAAQWTNPYTGRSFNNPMSSTIDTMLLHAQQRRTLERALARGRDGATAAPTRAPAAPPPSTRFKPSGSRPTAEATIQALAQTPELFDGLREAVTAIFDAFEKEAVKADAAHEVAAAIAFFIQAHYTSFKDGAEIGEAASDALLAQCREAFATPELVAAPDDQKQALYEFFVVMAGLHAAGFQIAVQEGDTEQRAALAKAGGEALALLLKVEASRISIDETGLHLAPAPPARPARPAPRPRTTSDPGP